MKLNDVQSWLDAMQNSDSHRSTNSPDEHASKRRRLNKGTARLTPPSTNNEMETSSNGSCNSSSSKRLRHDDNTPRPRRTQTSSRSHSARQSCRSGQTSPRKQIRSLKRDAHGLEMRVFNYVDMPLAAQALLDNMDAFSLRKGLVCISAREALLAAADEDGNFKWARLCDASLFTNDPSVRTPSPEAVRSILAAAKHCNRRGFPEAAWNEEVHSRVLGLAFRPSGQAPFEQLVDFVLSTTATIMPEYSNATTKRIDYCIYIDVENDKTLSKDYHAASERLRRALPEEVLNFTDYEPLDDCFVGIGIETKKPCESLETGQLQLAVWDMARWKFLRRLAAGAHKDEDIFAAAAREAEREARLPEFLPGIVVQGDDWFLVMTTMEQHKTVMWRKRAIGTTMSTEGIYQIVRTLQRLRQWVVDVHWPCIQRMVMEAH